MPIAPVTRNTAQTALNPRSLLRPRLRLFELRREAEKRRLLAPEKISPSAVNVEVRPMAAVFSQTAKIDADAVPGKSVSLGDDYYDAARRRRS